MKRYLPLFAVALVVASTASFAARVAQAPIVHPAINVYQAAPGTSLGNVLSQTGLNTTAATDVITAVPGVLALVPGTDWRNFVSATYPYFIKNVVLQKVVPVIGQCNDVFNPTGRPLTITQQGTANIRTWWPLLYEVPGTTWTLSLLVGGRTSADPYAVSEQWSWKVDATIASMLNAIDVFHELPFGTCEVPLISDEALYTQLRAQLALVQSGINAGNNVQAGNDLASFDIMVQEHCTTICPANKQPTGPGTGIINTAENPACCKLLADAEYVGYKYGIWVPAK